MTVVSKAELPSKDELERDIGQGLSGGGAVFLKVWMRFHYLSGVHVCKGLLLYLDKVGVPAFSALCEEL